ncbi:unnamed protein product [Linum trigynum]|uniref:Uncharacterized protein n=1 Tax=Linum trigynum TaxID=586398 RepID=A0AAV2D2H7_9ROSI
MAGVTRRRDFASFPVAHLNRRAASTITLQQGKSPHTHPAAAWHRRRSVASFSGQFFFSRPLKLSHSTFLASVAHRFRCHQSSILLLPVAAAIG